MVEITNQSANQQNALSDRELQLWRDDEVFKRNPGSQMWQIITGHKEVVDIGEIDLWVNTHGQITIPLSELSWYSRNNNKLSEKILGLTPEKLLDSSIVGVSDHLRIVAVTEEAYAAMLIRLNKTEYETTVMKDGIGIVIGGIDVPAVKVVDIVLEENRVGNKRPIQRVNKVEETIEKGFLLIVRAENLKTTVDWLSITDEIRNLDPKSADNMILDRLAYVATQAMVARDWDETLKPLYLDFSLPDSIRDLSNEARMMATTYAEVGIQFAKYLQNKNGMFDYSKPHLEQVNQISRILSEKKFKDKMLLDHGKKRIQKFVDNIIKIVKEDPTKEAQILRLTKNLWQRAMTQAATDQLVINRLGEHLRDQDNGKGIILSLTERAARLYPEKMKASAAARKLYYDNTKKEAPADWSMKDFAIWQNDTSLVKALVAQRGGINIILNQKEAMQSNFTELMRVTSNTILEHTNEYHDGAEPNKFPTHPMSDIKIWNALLDKVRVSTSNLAISNRQWELWKNVWDLKRQLALHQAKVVDRILNTMGNPVAGFEGGINGWNDTNKNDMGAILETAPSTGSNLREINCAGRMLLVAGIMLESSLMSEERLNVATTQSHTFMGFTDELGILRRLEISGRRHLSGYGGFNVDVERSSISGEKRVIGWTSWRKGVCANLLTSFLNHQDIHVRSKLKEIIDTIYPKYYSLISGTTK